MNDDSMSPDYNKGSILVCKEIEGDYITPGKPYLIRTKTDKLWVVRYIMKTGISALVRAHNQEDYPDHEIPNEEIDKLYLVRGQIEML